MNDTINRLDVVVILGLLTLLAGVFVALTFVTIPTENRTLFAALAMIVGNGLGVYLGYRWGSSRGSAAKDQTIADLAKGSGS